MNGFVQSVKIEIAYSPVLGTTFTLKDTKMFNISNKKAR